MRKIILFIAILLIAFNAQSQELESEVGYLYTKAKYLLETNRSSEAVELFTKIIHQDAHYKEAMALRANAKYRMGKNKKARKDIIRFIEENGLTPNAVKTLALINYADKDYDSAANSLHTASLLYPNDVELLEMRAEVLMKQGHTSEACIAWQDAAKLGSKKAKTMISKDCYANQQGDKKSGGIEYDPIDLPSKNKNGDDKKDTKEEDTNVEVETDDATTDKGEESDENTTKKDTQKEEKTEPKEEIEEYDITEIDLNEGRNKFLKLDEDLTINILGGGLGDRKIERMPNILLLTDAKGTIVVDLCIGKSGEVLAAEFNATESTMKHRNNQEYLLRKTKDLTFNKISEVKCGRIIYNINL